MLMLLFIGNGDLVAGFYNLCWLAFPVPRIAPWQARRRITHMDVIPSSSEGEESEEGEDEEESEKEENVFIPCSEFEGKREGYTYKDGGYYKDKETSSDDSCYVCTTPPPLPPLDESQMSETFPSSLPSSLTWSTYPPP